MKKLFIIVRTTHSYQNLANIVNLPFCQDFIFVKYLTTVKQELSL